MKVDDFVYDPTTELGWFSLSESRKLLKAAKNKGLVKENDGVVNIDFDHGSVKFPTGFKPSKNVLEVEKKEPLFPRMLSEVVKNGDMPRSELMVAVNKKQDDMNLEVEVALMLACAEKGIEVPNKERYIGEIKKKIRGESG
ncbi:MAG: DUF2240 family protein [Thermoplasmata archaeon]